MRRSNVQSIGEVINELLKEMHIDKKIKETAVINSWGELLGNNISRATTKLFIKNGILFVSLSSPNFMRNFII